jgi:hypothetical protein
VAHFQKRAVRFLGLCVCAAAVALVVGILLSVPARPQDHAASAVFRTAALARSSGAIRLPTGKLRTQTINPALRRSFAIFRHRPTEKVRGVVEASASGRPTFEGLVPEMVKTWLSRDASVLGQASAQNVEVIAADGTQVAVLPGTQGACMGAWLVLPGGGGGYGAGCGATSSVASRGISFSVHSAAGTSRMVGIVPDGNSSVSVTFASGQTDSVPVVSNVFNVTGNGSSHIGSVRFVNAHGGSVTLGGGS